MGGWLALLVVHLLVLRPLFGFSSVWAEVQLAESSYDIAGTEDWETWKSAVYAVFGLSSILSFLAGFNLLQNRNQRAIDETKWALWLVFPGTYIAYLFVTGWVFGIDDENFVAEGVVYLSGNFLIAMVWVIYLDKSCRVKNTYMEAQNPGEGVLVREESQSRIERSSSGMDSMTQKEQHVNIDPWVEQRELKTTIPYLTEQVSGGIAKRDEVGDDSHLYEIAWNEIENGNTDKGLWAKCFVKFKGEERKTKLCYLHNRIRILKNLRAREGLNRDQEEEAKRQERYKRGTIRAGNVSCAIFSRMSLIDSSLCDYKIENGIWKGGAGDKNIDVFITGSQAVEIILKRAKKVADAGAMNVYIYICGNLSRHYEVNTIRRILVDHEVECLVESGEWKDSLIESFIAAHRAYY